MSGLGERLTGDKYLLKPIRQSELREAIGRALGAADKRAQFLSLHASPYKMPATLLASCACCSQKTI